jgi:hypothetical protein
LTEKASKDADVFWGRPVDAAVALILVVGVPITIIVVAGCAIAWRSLTLPPADQVHVRKVIRLFGQIVRDLVGGGGRQP